MNPAAAADWRIFPMTHTWPTCIQLHLRVIETVDINSLIRSYGQRSAPLSIQTENDESWPKLCSIDVTWNEDDTVYRLKICGRSTD